jgi:hypothetical protein
MQITFGKCEGKTAQEVVLKQASYVKWVLDQTASGSLGNLQLEMERLIARLDNKPYACKCSKAGCTRPVSCLTAYANNDADLYPWCTICDPYTLGANSGKLTTVTSYKEMLSHVTIRCGATKGGYDRIVKAYARSKGLPARVGAASAAAFFA